MAAAAENVAQDLETPENRAVYTPLERLQATIAGNWTPDTLDWLRNAFSLYVLHGTPLEEALDLKPQAAGEQSPRRRLNLELRNSLIRALVDDAYGGDVKTFLDRLHRFETTTYTRWTDGPPPDATDEERLLHLLLDSFEVPRSRSAIYSITRPTD